MLGEVQSSLYLSADFIHQVKQKYSEHSMRCHMIEEVFLSGWLEYDLVTISWEHQGLSCQLPLCPSFPGQGNFLPFMHNSELFSGPKWTVKCRSPELLSLCSIFISITFPSKFNPSKLLWTLSPQLSRPPKLCVSSPSLFCNMEILSRQ